MPAAPAGHDDEQAQRALPVWPLWLLFGGFPVMWVLGLGGFATQIAAIPMATCLATRGRLRVPRGFGVWLLFIVWMLASVVEVHGGSRVLGFVYRATLYLAGTVVFVYVYNSSRRTLPLERVCAMAACFLGFVTIGGFLGVVSPHGSFTTPLANVLPSHLLHNDLVSKMVKPPFAQTADNQYVHVAPRPAAPFPYTNDWGVNFALVVPFIVAWLSCTKRARVRVGLVALLILGLIPAAITLNRGMALGLGVGIIYAAVRFALRGHGRALLGVVGVIVLAIALGSTLHFGSRLNQRLDNSGTNTGRLTNYSATYDLAKKSPILGYGAPTSSTVSVTGPDLGTQGQLWTVLYSSGFPGATFFVLAVVGFAWRTRRARTSPLMWLHVATIIAVVVLPVYRIQATELVLLMTAAALCLRDTRPPLAPQRPQRGRQDQQPKRAVVAV